MIPKILLRRQLSVTAVVALGAAGVVYSFHHLFHAFFSPPELADAIGAIVLVFSAFLAQHAVSYLFYRDTTLGQQRAINKETIRRSQYQNSLSTVSADLLRLSEITGLLRAQLQDSIDFTEQAAVDIVTRLHEIDAVVAKLDRLIAGNSASAEEQLKQAEASVAQNRQLLEQMNHYIEQRKNNALHNLARGKEVAAEAQALSNLIELVRKIAGQINLLALNAAIESARAGESGRGFAVVANEVSKLSSETETAVDRISNGIRSLHEHITERFRSEEAEQTMAHEQEMLRVFSSQLSELAADHNALVHHQSEMFAEVGMSSQQLTKMFMDAQASVQFQDVSRQQIELVMQATRRIDDYMAGQARRLTAEDPEAPPPLSITAVRLKREQIQLVVDGDVVGTGVAARKGLLQGHLLEKSD